MPRVSVVMAVHNAGRFVREAVASVLAQSFRDFELIAIDDASSDESLSILKDFVDSRMRIIRHRVNLGAALSRNDAFGIARGEFIAIMDADDICAPARLEKQVAYLDENPAVGLVGCGVYDNIDVKGAVLFTSVMPKDNEAIQSISLERWCFLHSSIMFRRELRELAGSYRGIFEPVEDHDLVLRILEHSRAYNIPERLVSYRLNPQGLSAAGHAYAGELTELAIRMARRRRTGQPEDIESERPRILELKRQHTTLDGAVEVNADLIH
jgi:glycosyltransferase involved in cell wall biosynthesis